MTEKGQILEQFRAFLRSLMMHAGIGTALGGVMTMVGEPQNLIISKYERDRREKLQLITPVGVWLISALAFHLTEVGSIGLSVIILII